MTEKILTLIEELLKIPNGTITTDTMAEDVEEWDSLAHVMLIGELEERFGISIPLEEAIEIKGVKDILAFCKTEE
ncbi:MAG: acyl carrier protein [Lachnospiraceae bacterium]|nr:acyl carrier protein [Butyrivibrio sp.]MCM1342742.1 acyl carrier protein [Muribaculaceae bacterium]MCM1409994.1 acyl carrier protein [Lachnospiraceae bacterium]